jgi:hypothetical protein
MYTFNLWNILEGSFIMFYSGITDYNNRRAVYSGDDHSGWSDNSITVNDS